MDNLFGLIDDVVKTLLGFFLGVISNLLFRNSKFINYFTKDFNVNLKINTVDTSGSDITKINLKYAINSKTSEEVMLNYVYIELPKHIKGNFRGNTTLGEVFSEKGKYFILDGPELIKHSFERDIEIRDQEILKYIGKNKEIKKIRLVANTSKYGDVKSNTKKILDKQAAVFHDR